MSNFALPMELPGFAAAVKDAGSSFAPSRMAACISFSLADESQIPQAVHLLSEMLRDSELQIRVQAVESLAALAERGATVDKALLQSIFDNGQTEVRAALLQNGYLLLPSPWSTARDAADSSDDLLRYSAAILLGALLDDGNTPDIRNTLLSLLDDTSLDVRVVAAFQLGAQGTEKSAVLLESLIENQDDTAIEATVILAQLGLPQSRIALENMARKRFASPTLRAMCGAALLRMTDTDHADVLQNMLQSWRKSRRMAALRACAAIPFDSLAEILAQHIVAAAGEDEQSAALWGLWQVVLAYPHCAPVLDKLRVRLGRGLLDELSEYEKGYAKG